MARSKWFALPSIDQSRRRGRVSRVSGAARTRGRRSHRAARAEPDGACRVFSCAARCTAHRLVSQRRHPAELAVPAVLSPVSAVRADARHANRRVVRAAAKTAPALQEWQAKCVVIPFGVEKTGRIARQSPRGPKRFGARSDGRSCCSSDGSSPTRVSTCCSTRCANRPLAAVLVGDGPLSARARTPCRNRPAWPIA